MKFNKKEYMFLVSGLVQLWKYYSIRKNEAFNIDKARYSESMDEILKLKEKIESFLWD